MSEQLIRGEVVGCFGGIEGKNQRIIVSDGSDLELFERGVGGDSVDIQQSEEDA